MWKFLFLLNATSQSITEFFGQASTSAEAPALPLPWRKLMWSWPPSARAAPSLAVWSRRRPCPRAMARCCCRAIFWVLGSLRPVDFEDMAKKSLEQSTYWHLQINWHRFSVGVWIWIKKIKLDNQSCLNQKGDHFGSTFLRWPLPVNGRFKASPSRWTSRSAVPVWHLCKNLLATGWMRGAAVGFFTFFHSMENPNKDKTSAKLSLLSDIILQTVSPHWGFLP